MKKITVACAKRENYNEFKKVHDRFTFIDATAPRGPLLDDATFNDYADRESLFLAYEDNVLVGYAILDCYEDMTCDVQEIFILPEYQRNGYGKQLVDHIKEVAKRDGVKKLNVFSIMIETDEFWMMKCHFYPDDKGYLVYLLN